MRKRFLGFIAFTILIVLIFFIFNENSRSFAFISSWFIISLLVYIGGEMLWTFIKNGNYFIISGLVIMLITIITFLIGYWEKGLINNSFIVAVAVLASFFTLKDFVEIGDFSENFKKNINAFLFICTISFICSILMVSPDITKLNNLNTDYLAFISLGIAISNIGLRQQKLKKQKLTNN